MKIVLTILTIYYLYHLGFLLASLPLRRQRIGEPKGDGKNRFAVFLPAHNEENVIFKSVRSVLSIHYPRDKFDIFVIADNCTDSTAEKAVLAGARVLKRCDKVKKGKQFALEWAFKQVNLNSYDAVIILDADNSVDPYLLSVLDCHLQQGHKVIQAYEESKNPADSWVAMNNAYMYWYLFRLQMIRSRLGLSAWLAGTGVCISTDILKCIGWHVTTITEDVELTCQLLLAGEKVHLAEGAVVYDQKPNNLKDSWLQRLRWIRGQTQVTFKYVPRLFLQSVKWWLKGDLGWSLRAFDGVMWVPMQFVLLGSFMISILSHGWQYIFSLLLSVPVLYFMPLLAEEVKIKKAWAYLLTSGLFWLTWVPITAYGVISFDKKGWFRTPH